MNNLDELERMAKRYTQLKKSGNDVELAQLASDIVDSLASVVFVSPEEGAL